MSCTKSLGDASTVTTLANRLADCLGVRLFDRGDDKREAWTVAHAFADIEEAARRFVDELLHRLVRDALCEKQVEDLLLDKGEEFRHLLYHIHDPGFYRYLHEQSEGNGPD